ncbi:MAG TPA: hypothetical protein VML55_12645, partial [Planctomycetaceae bacterium]|nr:hypothetical protein [Planctomycetaceae bacterium]
AAWCTVAWCAAMFFLVPIFAPKLAPELRTNPDFLAMNQMVRLTTVRPAAPSDVEQRAAAIALWDERKTRLERAEEQYAAALEAVRESDEAQTPPAAAQLDRLAEATARRAAEQRSFERSGPRPAPLGPGEPVQETTETGGSAVYWSGGIKPVDAEGNALDTVKPRPVGEPEQVDERTTQLVLAWPEGVWLKGFGNFRPDFLLYDWAGMDLRNQSNAMLETLTLPPKIVTPFLVMIVISLVTRRNSREALDRYYAKMKTPVDPDPERDRRNLEAAYANPEALEGRKLFPGTSLEIQKPTAVDVIGFVVSVAVCFGIIGLAMVVARIGS